MASKSPLTPENGSTHVLPPRPKDWSFLTALVLAGFLKPSMEGVNIVSAPAKTKEMGIDLSETKKDKSSTYQTLISVTVVTASGSNVVAGTVFGEHPRIVDINGVPVEAGVGKNMLYIVNADQPGLIGSLGTLLGDANINIADFTLGRISGKKKAIALISIDEKISEGIVDKIAKLPHVERVQALEF